MKLRLTSDIVPSELEELLPELQRFARSLTGNSDLADDIAQESIVRALQRDATLPAITNFRGWLFQIAANVFKEWWRRHQRQTAQARVFAENQHLPTSEQPFGVVEHRERLDQIWKFVESLPAVQRQVLMMKMVEGYSNQQIATQLAMSPGSVKSNLNIARTKLRSRFLLEEGESG